MAILSIFDFRTDFGAVFGGRILGHFSEVHFWGFWRFWRFWILDPLTWARVGTPTHVWARHLQARPPAHTPASLVNLLLKRSFKRLSRYIILFELEQLISDPESRSSSPTRSWSRPLAKQGATFSMPFLVGFFEFCVEDWQNLGVPKQKRLQLSLPRGVPTK